MTIIRDGKEYELTTAEIIEAWKERTRFNTRNDIVTTIQSMGIEGATEKDYENIRELLYAYMDQGGYWDIRQDYVDSAVEDYFERKYD